MEELTPAERLWLWRQRQVTTTGRTMGRVGARWSQREAAGHLYLPPREYARLEGGAATVEDLPDCARELVPTVTERCLLARRRSGLTVSAVCARLGGVTRPTLYRMERDADPNLLELWGL